MVGAAAGGGGRVGPGDSVEGGGGEVDRGPARGARRGVGFDDGGGCGCDVAAGGLRAGLDDGRGRGGRRRGGVGVVRGHHAGEHGRDGGGGRRLGGGGLRWGGVGGGGAVGNEEGPAVDPWSGVLRVARFGVTWRPETVSIRRRRSGGGRGCLVIPTHTAVSTHPMQWTYCVVLQCQHWWRCPKWCTAESVTGV